VTPVVAAVGTTHPYAAAGLLLDLAAIRALGAQPVAVVAGVSAQDAGRVLARAPVDPATVAAQFDALAGVPIGAFCVGALLDAPSVRAVAAGLARYPGVPVICDPVIAASGGDRLASDATIAAMRDVLFGRCTLLTPNLAEAALLTGTPVADPVAMRAALPSGSPRFREYSHGIVKAKASNKAQANRRIGRPYTDVGTTVVLRFPADSSPDLGAAVCWAA